MAPSNLAQSNQPPSWQTLLNEALTRPGIVSEALDCFGACLSGSGVGARASSLLLGRNGQD